VPNPARNNNAYAKDNATAGSNWSLCDTNADLLRFVRLLIDLAHFDRKLREDQNKRWRITFKKSRIEWHGIEIGKPTGEGTRTVSHCPCTTCMHNGCVTLAINAYWKPLEFELPFSGACCRSMDHVLFPSWAGLTAFHVRDSSYRVNSRSIVMLDCDHEQAVSSQSQSSRVINIIPSGPIKRILLSTYQKG